MRILIQESLKEYAHSQLLTPFLRISDNENQWKITYHRSYHNKKQNSVEWATIKVTGVFCEHTWRGIKKNQTLLEYSKLDHSKTNSIIIKPAYETYKEAVVIVEKGGYLIEEAVQNSVAEFFERELITTKKTSYLENILAEKIEYLIEEGKKSEIPGLKQLYADLSTTKPSEKIYKILFNILLEKYTFGRENPVPKLSLANDLNDAGYPELVDKVFANFYEF